MPKAMKHVKLIQGRRREVQKGFWTNVEVQWSG